MNKPLVLAYRLAKWFPLTRGIKRALQRYPIIYARAVDIIDFSIYQGETFALVGESGSEFCYYAQVMGYQYHGGSIFCLKLL